MQERITSQPFLGTRLIGRAAELAAIQDTIAAAAAGVPQLLIVSGEAGLGKTRLCRAVIELCQAADLPLLVGQALSHATAMPFGPFLDAFRRFLATQSATDGQ